MNLFTAKALRFQKGNAKLDPVTARDSARAKEADYFELDLEEELLLQQHLEQQLREDEEMGYW